MSTYDPYYHKVSLLLSGGGPDGGTSIVDATGKVVSRYGDTKYSPLKSKFRSTSIAFDAAGDGLSVPGSSDFAFGTGDFTIESWVYLTNYNQALVSRWTTEWVFIVFGDGTLCFAPQYGSYPLTSTTVPKNQWVHLAATRANGVLRFFIDGVKGYEGSGYTQNYTNTIAPVYIGIQDATQVPVTNGYLEDVRITKGVARYVTDFTPPDAAFYTRGAELLGTVTTSGELEDWEVVAFDAHSHQYMGKADVNFGEYKIGPMDPFKQYMLACRPRVDGIWSPKRVLVDEVLVTATDPTSVPYIYKLTDRADSSPASANTRLLLTCDGDNNGAVFTDLSANPLTVASVNVVTRQDIYKFPNASAYFNGSSAYLNITDTAKISLGASAFTIEGWLYITSFATPFDFYSRVSATYGIAYEHRFQVIQDGLGFYHGTRGSNQSVVHFYWVTPIPLNTWVHVAVQRASNGAWLAYLNGVPTQDYIYAPLSPGLNYGPRTTGTFNNPVNLGSHTIPLMVGASPMFGSYSSGYLDFYRVTIGEALYQGSFTPPGLSASGDYEPQWPTTIGASVVDGDFTWTNAGRLVRPQMHGPLIPR